MRKLHLKHAYKLKKKNLAKNILQLLLQLLFTIIY